MKIKKGLQCVAIVQPGEYLVSRWDNKRCSETSPMHLFKCEECGNYYCLMMHWGKHNHDNGKEIHG